MENRLAVNKTYKIYVDGKFPRTESGRYYEFKSPKGDMSANICQCSRKDLRDAVTAARNAQGKWASATAYNRGQVLYRIAEMLEARKGQFIEELLWQGSTETEAKEEVALAIDRLVYYAGWSDKYQQIFSTVNPVASSHFNFSMLEPTGIVNIAAPESPALLGLVSLIAPVIIGGNTCVVLGSASRPLSAVTFAEVLNSSDVPSGVVNILTGFRKELLSQLASHMDVNAVVYAGDSLEEKSAVETQSIENLKRVRSYMDMDWDRENNENPYMILDFQETKTTWHPVGI
jgi:acyl-CoA reductase-like NAD-dependent aldehyde dehydrogenase